MSCGKRVLSATSATALTSFSLFWTDSLSKDGFTIVLQVGHHFAVKSTTTGRPSARAAATASGLHFSQAKPLGATLDEPEFPALSLIGARHSSFDSSA